MNYDQIQFHNAFKKFIRRPEIFALQGCEGDWLAGGCWKLAHAIWLWLGDDNVELWALSDKNQGIQHIVAKLGDYYLDGDGLADETEIIHRFIADWPFSFEEENLYLEPFADQEGAQGIPPPDQQTVELARKLSERFPEYRANPVDSDGNRYEELQSDLFRESGHNATFPEKIDKYYKIMKDYDGWGPFPPIEYAGVSQVDEYDLEEYNEADEAGYAHELAWSRPISEADLGMWYAHLDDGHHRSYAARRLGIPLRVTE